MLREGWDMLWVLQAAPYKYMLAIGTVPFLVYAAVPMRHPVKEVPKVFESNTFVNRWPTQLLVEHVRVRTISLKKPEPEPEPVVADDDAIVEVAMPRKKISTRRPIDICARHNRRRVVYYVRGYKHWRCRR